MRTLWKGAISFGLVTIPVSLYPATRKEELKFRMLRKSDLSPINYKRVAEADGKEVPWEEIVKGYKHEKGKYVILKEEDFAYRDALENLIEEKIEHGDKVGPAPSKPEGTRQFFGSIIVGFYRGKKPIFAGKVGTGAPLTAGANGPRYYRFGDEALPLGGTPNGLSGQIRRVDAG
jgi:hypothetical protein